MPTITLMLTRRKNVCVCREMPAGGIPSAGLTWETDERGFISSARGKDVEVNYRYDDEGYPLGKSTTSKDMHLSVVSTPSNIKGKKLDYTSVSTLNDKPLGNVKQTCEYDKHDNPVACQLRLSIRA
jgi:hypothetical protein